MDSQEFMGVTLEVSARQVWKQEIDLETIYRNRFWIQTRETTAKRR